MFDAAELDTFLDLATYAVLNDYEAQMVVDKTGRAIETLAQKVGALIVTRGGQGSDIFVGGRMLHIPAARTRRVVDPTGCGDAYRAGLLYGLANGMDWETTGRLAAVMGALKIEQSGAQKPCRLARGDRRPFRRILRLPPLVVAAATGRCAPARSASR